MENRVVSEAEAMQAAFAHYQAGRLAEAGVLFDRVLEANPARVGALLMRGLIHTEADPPDPAAAEALFHRCLAVSPGNFLALNHLGQLHQGRDENLTAVGLFERSVAGNPAFAPAWNNLGVSLHRLGRRGAALDAFDRALAADANLVMVHGNRGHVLADLGRWDESIAAFRQALAGQPETAELWRSLATACHRKGAEAEAEEACRQALALDPGDIESHVELASILERAGRVDEARASFAEAARLTGVVVAPCTGGPPQARVLIVYAQGGGNVPTKYLFDRQRFETISVHLPPPGHGAGLDEVLAGLPPYDIVFSAVGEGGGDDPFVRQAAELVAKVKVPVLNRPDLIPATTRDRLPAMLAGIPRLVVPAVRRLVRGDLERLAAGLPPGGDRPVLIRPVGSHGGHDLARLDGAADLARYLEATPQPEFYVSEFFDYRSRDGRYRKYRFLFVEGVPYSYHLAIHDHWLIHYFRADMAHEAWMKREEEAFLANYPAVFSGPLAAAVQAAGRRLGLDYGGMDCALTTDGRVLVFEANACMLLHLQDSPEEFPYKHRYVPRIVDAVSTMVLGRLAGRGVARG